MAKYEVTFSCGHTETMQLYGKEVDRQRKIEWYKDHCKCTECSKASRDAASAKAAEDNKADGYAPLTGSEKQIAWAETIRREKIAEFDANSKYETDKYIVEFAKTQLTDAGNDWIENRNMSLTFIVGQHKPEFREWYTAHYGD